MSAPTPTAFIGDNLPVINWPDPTLQKMCATVFEFNDDLNQLIADMTVTMRMQQGLGLAAPQVGYPIRLILIENTNHNGIAITDLPAIPLINPNICEQSNELFEWNEGCLSVPGVFINRKRNSSISVEYQTASGDVITSQFTGLTAFVIQHEIDHLNGVVFVDGLSSFKTSRIMDKMKKTIKKRQR